MFEFGGSQNLMEFMFSYYQKIDVQDLVNDTRSWNASSAQFLENLGIDNKTKGEFKFVKDPKILDQLEKSDFVAGIYKNQSEFWDNLFIQKLDQISWRTTFFLEYHGGQSKDETVIIPFEVEANFLMGLR
jgi:hypothetical protein